MIRRFGITILAVASFGIAGLLLLSRRPVDWYHRAPRSHIVRRVTRAPADNHSQAGME
jgi:hypothetical protein